MRNIKLVVVGDGATGKTELLMAYSNEHTESIYSGYYVNIRVDGETVSLSMWDTAAQEDYDRLRPLSYPQTDVFLVCFSVIGRSSFENVSTKWVPEIKHHCPNTPFLLVGTKSDLRNNPAVIQKIGAAIRPEEAQALAHELGAVRYVECSALTGQNLGLLFDAAVRAAMAPRPKPQKKHWNFFKQRAAPLPISYTPHLFAMGQRVRQSLQQLQKVYAKKQQQCKTAIQSIQALLDSRQIEVQDATLTTALERVRDELTAYQTSQAEVRQALNDLPISSTSSPDVSIDAQTARKKLDLFNQVVFDEFSSVVITALAFKRELVERRRDRLDGVIKAIGFLVETADLFGWFAPVVRGVSLIVDTRRQQQWVQHQRAISGVVGDDLITATELVTDAANRVTHDYQDQIVRLAPADLERVARCAAKRLIAALRAGFITVEGFSAGESLAFQVRHYTKINARLDIQRVPTVNDLLTRCGIQITTAQGTACYQTSDSMANLGYRYGREEEVEGMSQAELVPTQLKWFYYEQEEARVFDQLMRSQQTATSHQLMP